MSQVTDPDSLDEFEYSGWLSFYLYKTEIKGELENITSGINLEEKLKQRLPKYGQGTPSDPGDGFRVTNTRELLRQAGLLDEYPFLDETVHVKYIQEEYQERLAYIEEDDDFRETSTLEISTSDLFWMFPKFLFTRASKQVSDNIRTRMRSTLVNSLRTEKIEFNRDFFIWLIYNNYSGEETDSLINIQQLQSIELVGQPDTFASSSKFSNAESGSAVALLQLLEGDSPQNIEAMFNYCDRKIVVNISHDRIQILTSKELPEKLSDLEKMALSVSFVSEFISLYEMWTNLPNEEKYPPTSSFKEIYKRGIDEGYETEGISSQLIERFEKLRGDK